jgi:2-dehydro-3-deoxyphosphogluconate aldolase/(4S)-4-hydroxy-2-oxoglutarate aldolase
MYKHEVLKRIMDVGVVAVVRAENKTEAINISKACIEGGIPAIEVTFTVPGAEDVIKALDDAFDDNSLIVGAGTVLDSETARVAILKGAKYIVSPGFDLETAKLCNRYQVPYMPGCLTITEMLTAMSAGVDIVKLFPGSAFGPSYVKAVKGPLPQVNIMPTGGVSLSNVDAWIKNGVVAIGVGGQLTGPAKNKDYDGVKQNAIAFVEAVKKARMKA